MAEIIIRTAADKSINAKEKRPLLEPKACRYSRHRIFYGWFVIVAAGVGMFLGAAPIVVFSFGVFLKPLTEEFHAGRGIAGYYNPELQYCTRFISGGHNV